MEQASGYHKLSSYMVDEHYTIFRQFKLLANRDLLYLQAELSQLESELLIIADRDRKSGGEEKLYDKNWHLLSTSKSRCDKSEQWDQVLLIRRKLAEYCNIFTRHRSPNFADLESR